jgi:hypothetical protein
MTPKRIVRVFNATCAIKRLGARAVGGTEMVLAEEDPLVAERLGARPEIKIPIEIIG